MNFFDLQESRDLRILDIDIETRKVGFHSAGRFKPDGCEPVIIAASWLGDDQVSTFSLGSKWKESDMRKLLEGFLGYYHQADVITGHYISKFDLPIINAALLEFSYEPLGPKLVHDTKTHFKNTAGHSLSQENLSALQGLEDSKFHMNDHMWRQVTRLTDEGLALAKERVVKDVIQHKALRGSLLKWLSPAEIWE